MTPGVFAAFSPLRKVVQETDGLHVLPAKVQGALDDRQSAPLLSAPKPRQEKAYKIDPYVPYLEQRMAEGVFNARKLYRELATQGYPGGETQVRAFVHDHRPPCRQAN